MRRGDAFMAQRGVRGAVVAVRGRPRPSDSISVDKRERRPGEQLYRVKMNGPNGKNIGVDAAHELVAKKPWFATARYIGTSNGYYIWAFTPPAGAA